MDERKSENNIPPTSYVGGIISLCIDVIWPQGYKTFFMLNSAKHEIFSANKYENANSREIFMLSYV